MTWIKHAKDDNDKIFKLRYIMQMTTNTLDVSVDSAEWSMI